MSKFYLTSIFLDEKIRAFQKRNLIGQRKKELNNCILKDNRFLIILEVRNIFTLFSHKLQMENTCKLHSKCLKEDESLEECNTHECQNVIHLSCLKKLLATFGENKCEGPFFCGNDVSITTKSAQGGHKQSLRKSAMAD